MPRCFAAVLLVSLSTLACAQEAPQPVRETLDLATISRIRDEGLNHSHVMKYASGLADGVGPRLTGSPEFERGAAWAILQLNNLGMANAHEESWGEFGMAWTQVGTSLQLVEPSPGTLLAQATPWSPATNGEVEAGVILVPEMTDEREFAAWKGKLAGKIILYGEAPAIDPNPKPPLVTVDAAYIARRMKYPLPPDDNSWIAELNFSERVAKFFAEEDAVAVLRTTGEAGMIRVDNFASMGWWVYQESHKQPLPSAVVSADGYGRMARLLQKDVPVRVRLNLRANFGASHVDGQNVIAEIPGTDPLLKDQVVMLGGHLDSWAAGTGATDDGAAVVIAIEAMRILKALGVQPRRTIRVGLWGGEEEGELGSRGYVDRHFAKVEYPGTPDIPTEMQRPVAITPKPEFGKLDVYFNSDAGGGRYLGISSEGNSAAANIFQQWARPLADLGFATVSLQHKTSIDSVVFNDVGLPGFEFMQDLRDYDTRTHHTNLDTYERLSEQDLKQAAIIMAVFVYNAAQRDTMFPLMPAPNPNAAANDKPLGVYPR